MRIFRGLGALCTFSVFSGAFSLNATNSTGLPPKQTTQEPAATSLPYNPILANGAAGLSNEQKISIVNGGDLDGNVTWNAYQLRDGEAGVNLQFHVSGFTMVHALTMTWNRDLYAAQFKAVGDEFYALGFQIVDGPLPGQLGRVPWGGRQPEGFSPDPYLTGIALGKAVTAMNSAGVITGARHLLLNEQETHRMASGPFIPNYSSNADDKTVQELYLWPWGDGVKAGLMAVMCGMNRVNGSQSCENNDVPAGYLKTKLGFPGLVYPDVESQKTAFGSVNGGLDLGSSQIWSQRVLLQGLANGQLTQERLDDMAVRNLMGYYFVGLDNGLQPPPVASETEYRGDIRGNHSAIIRQVSNEAIVLLKNSNVTGLGLPLKKPRTVSLYGSHAGPAIYGPNFGFNPISGPAETFQGHLASGTGSGQLSLPYLVTPFQALSDRAMNDNSMIWWIFNNTYASTGNGPFIVPNATDFANPPGGGGGVGVPGAGHFGGGTGEYPSFQNYAKNSDVCLVFINADSGEGTDRITLFDPVQDTMVTTVAKNCNNTIVVVNTAGPRILDAWIENPNVTAVLYAGLLGQNSGLSIADVLYGDVNPSGKLAHTIAQKGDDYPAKVCHTAACEFTEGTLIDYRWFDANNISVRYPFGHGLSYTEFTYGAATAAVTNSSAISSPHPTGGMGLGGESDLWDEVVSVKITIQNSGAVAGAEVAQLYVSFPAEAKQPVRVLRGFEKPSIQPGASAPVTFSLRRRDISYWNVITQKWTIASGKYTFSVGSSSRDIRATTTLTL
ncbi:glycoside hydrolase superfamily [Xylariales sp. PMI_506]|nr:glycoside hydrolase superfamily [Xylariales sp. PMI_506]